MIDIKELQALCADPDNVILTHHVLERIRQREIERDDLFNVVSTGKIIEQYPNDYPFPSCLILGNSLNGSPLHLVCGSAKNKVWFVTVYFPDPDEWEDDLKTRRGK